MKRMWIAVAIIVALAGLGCVHVLCLKDLTGELDGLLTQAEAQVKAGDWSRAEALTREALELWEDSAFYLHTTLRHDEIDSTLATFREVLAYLEGQERQPAEYAAANARLRVQIGLLLEAELPDLKNVL